MRVIIGYNEENEKKSHRVFGFWRILGRTLQREIEQNELSDFLGGDCVLLIQSLIQNISRAIGSLVT